MLRRSRDGEKTDVGRVVNLVIVNCKVHTIYKRFNNESCDCYLVFDEFDGAGDGGSFCCFLELLKSSMLYFNRCWFAQLY